MWTVWVVLVLLLVAVSLYAAKLARYEEDQLFLGDAFNHVKAEQADILAKVNKIQPLQRIALGLAVAMTLVVLGYYVLDILKQFQ
jgi:hypothetical protein